MRQGIDVMADGEKGNAMLSILNKSSKRGNEKTNLLILFSV